MTKDKELPEGGLEPKSDEKIITSVLDRLYLPVPEDLEHTQHDFMTHGNVLSDVRDIVSCDSDLLYAVMEKLGFKSRTIDGTLYWVVYEP